MGMKDTNSQEVTTMKTANEAVSMKVTKTKIDLKTGKQTDYIAEVQRERDEQHPIYTLTYEGYQTPWKEVA
jgi:hypothetical protein